MIEKTVSELARALSTGSVSSVELTQAFIDRITSIDTQLNSYITVDEEAALRQARQADDARSRGTDTLLLGIPIAHKDLFCTQGTKTTCGSKMLKDFVSPYDATVVARLKDSGAVTLGKTNCDEFAMGSSNENSFFGPTRNPWGQNRVPGGSSGGSASAVAADLCAMATGTDTGGSIRQPASFCGVTGLKPTYGRVSRWGMIAYASSLDVGGPLAKTAHDAAIMLNAIAGHDSKDSTSVSISTEDYTQSLDAPLTNLRIGLPRQYFSKDLDPRVATIIQETARDLEKLGATLVDIDLQKSTLSLPAYYVIAPAEASTNLSRYDGVRYGYRCDDPLDLEDMYTRSRTEGFGNEVKRRIMIGTYALSAGYYDAYYKKAQKIRRLVKQDFDNAFQNVDVILSPTSPFTAFELGAKKDPVSMYLEDVYTLGVNLAGIPGISVPAGFIDGLPIGAQLIAPDFKEGLLLNIAHQYQQNSDWHKQKPSISKGVK
ncbi:MAG: Asp-tRNA(Asn)/Glu-tRNA(Gln) amidotransferase GatCAB subunit A [Deltaproteobacteria bacterium]|jgi:aspartyl-tRNA(Asn)/glutamyl-tRNA(Gln) amidotransferase subunit A|nr:Asp-tRNA(Asn)/Glu-tRNA(Gln) amidotransferase GatCAB subunit A [Deltaproteobacteria bacterium]|tara:strand:+ start:6508 stop:7968 length:1461 start_codon:yes stop_codon:yes gene_type:complete